jgi:sn-glycerol 3-phosphate transport system permease protein
MKYKALNWFIPLVFIFPSATLLGVFSFWAVGHTIYLSTLDWNLIAPQYQQVGLANFGEILTTREFWLSFLNTLYYTSLFLLLIFAIPYFAAFFVMRVGVFWQNYYKALLFLPSIVSLAVLSIIFLWLYNPLLGPIDGILKAFNIRIHWLTDPQAVVPALAVITAFKLGGYNFILFLAGLVSVPRTIGEAASLDGASTWRAFWQVYRPLTSATALFVLATTVVMGAQFIFVPIHMLTGGGPNYHSANLIYLIFQYAFGFFLSGKAAAVAVITLLAFSGLIFLQAKVLERRVHYES